MRVDIVSIFPDMFEAPLSASLLGLARERGLLEIEVHDLRGWTTDKHHQVDDTPYGGGPGMVMKPEPFFRAVQDLKADADEMPTVILMTPQGRTFHQDMATELAATGHLIVLCGRYEGFDERVRGLVDIELSIGDYVLTGGELPALVLVDAVARLLPGVLGHEDSTGEESFSWGLLEYPQYTRPPVWEGQEVPEILRSGDHGAIARWRRARAIEKTARLRPDLLDGAGLTVEERDIAERTRRGQTRSE